MFAKVSLNRLKVEAHAGIGGKNGGKYVGAQCIMHHVRLHVVAQHFGRKCDIFTVTV